MNNLTEKLTPGELSNFTTQWRLHNAENADIVPYGAKKVADPIVHPFYKTKAFKPEYEDLGKLDYKAQRAEVIALKAKGINPYSNKYNIYDSINDLLVEQGVNFKDYRNDAGLFDYSDNFVYVAEAKVASEQSTPEWTINDNTSEKPIATKKECKG